MVCASWDDIWRFSPGEGSLSWAESLPGLGRACDCWAALSLERRPSGGRPHSCPPSASSGFESTETERERVSQNYQISLISHTNREKLFNM